MTTNQVPTPQNTQTLPTESFIYKVGLQEIGRLWAIGLKYPNGDPIVLTDVHTFVDKEAGQIFIQIVNVCPTREQLVKK